MAFADVQLCAGFDIPESDGTVAVCRGQPLPIRREVQPMKWWGMESPDFVPRRAVSDDDASLAVGGQQVPLRRPHQVCRFVAGDAFRRCLDRLAGAQIPEADLIESGRDEPLAVRRHGDRPDELRVTRQLSHPLAGGDAPHANDPRNVFAVQVAAVGGHNLFSVRGIGDGENAVLVPCESAHGLAGGDVPEFHFVAPGRGQRRSIGREGERTRCHGIFQDLDALVALEVPQSDRPAALTDPVSHGQRLPIG